MCLRPAAPVYRGPTLYAQLQSNAEESLNVQVVVTATSIYVPAPYGWYQRYFDEYRRPVLQENEGFSISDVVKAAEDAGSIRGSSANILFDVFASTSGRKRGEILDLVTRRMRAGAAISVKFLKWDYKCILYGGVENDW